VSARSVAIRQTARVAAVAAATTLVTRLAVETSSVSGAEESVFRLINGAPEVPFVIPWVLMQVGNVGAALVAAAVAWSRRGRRLALALLVGGFATWLLAKGLKATVDRGRPAALLDDVVLRHAATGGYGWVSGHAAVVAALLTIGWRHLGQRWQLLAVMAVAMMSVARVYVGEHLPLDMAGGVSFGVLCGTVVAVALDHGRHRPSTPSLGSREAVGTFDPGRADTDVVSWDCHVPPRSTLRSTTRELPGAPTRGGGRLV
jgi:membrane-associated phospholipid phosphatase